MGKAGVGLVALVIGLVLGGAGATMFAGPAMMGAGAGAGVLTGACAVAASAQGLGYLSAMQVDEVFANLPKQLGSDAAPPPAAAGATMAESCAKILAKGGK